MKQGGLRLLLFCCCLAAAATDPLLVAPQGPPAAVTPRFWDAGVINVCTAETAPIIYCSGREPADYDGYEIVLFRRVAKGLGWSEERLNWTCWDDYDAMLQHLTDGDGVCDVSPAGIGITPTTLANGYTFTMPTLNAGYLVMVSTSQATYNYWIFMDTFEWSLWVALVLTAVGVGVVLWLLEPWAKPRRKPTKDDFRAEDLQEQVWIAMGRPMQTRDMMGRSLATNLIVTIFAFMMLIMVAIYTANTSANLTATHLQTRITGVKDLPGRRVATWDDPEYLGDLAKRGIQATGLPWDTEADQQAMFDSVANGTFDALVLDSYVLQYGAASSCDLMTVGDVFTQYYGAVAFPSNFNDSELLKAYNAVLADIQKSGDMEALYAQYVEPPSPACKTSSVQSTTQQVSFLQVSGLWMLLAASIGVALIIVLLSHLVFRGARRVADTDAFKRLRLSGSETLSRLTSRVQSASLSGSAGGSGSADGLRGSFRMGWRRRRQADGAAVAAAGAGAVPGSGGVPGGRGGVSSAQAELESAWRQSVELQQQQQRQRGASAPGTFVAVGAGSGSAELARDISQQGSYPLPSLPSGSLPSASYPLMAGAGSLPGNLGSGLCQPAVPSPSQPSSPGSSIGPQLQPAQAPPQGAPCLSEAQLSAPATLGDVVTAVRHLEGLLMQQQQQVLRL